MDVPRVAVFTDDLGLVVSLGLHSSAMDFEQVHDVDALEGHDAVLVDVPREAHLPRLVEVLEHPEVPIVVLAGEQLGLPDGIAPLRRPCSLDTVVHALEAVIGTPLPQPQDAVAVGAEPAPPLFTTPRAPVAAGWSSQPETRPEADAEPVIAIDAVPEPVAAPAAASRSSVADLVRQLREAAGSGTTLGSSTVVTAAIADSLAEALQEATGADHVCLWSRFGDHHVVAGVVGGPAGAADVRLPLDHPVLRSASGNGGMYLHSFGSATVAPTGLPGWRAPTFGAVVLRDASPVDAITMAGPSLSDTVLTWVRDQFAA